MNGLIVLAACVCAGSAQFIAAPARAFAPVQQSHQFHAQDEFGQFTFGHAGGPSARTESRNAFGVTQGSYQYVDANGILQTVNYIADPVNGFRVAGTNLPAAPAPLDVALPVGPVFDLVGPAPVQDTPEVAAARAEHLAAVEAAKVAAASRKRRSAQVIAAPAAGLGLGLPYPYAAGFPAALPAATPLAAPALAYNAVSAPATREAVLTTIKLNPGHATFYRVD